MIQNVVAIVFLGCFLAACQHMPPAGETKTACERKPVSGNLVLKDVND